MKTTTLLMTPFSFFFGVVCYIQCMWWAPHDFIMDRDIFFPRIDLSQQACVCDIGVLLMEAEMGFTSPQWVGATLASQGGSQISESHVDKMVGRFLKMSILVFKNLGTKLSIFVTDCLFVEEEFSLIVVLLLSNHQMKNGMDWNQNFDNQMEK